MCGLFLVISEPLLVTVYNNSTVLHCNYDIVTLLLVRNQMKLKASGTQGRFLFISVECVCKSTAPWIVLSQLKATEIKFNII